MSNIDLTRLITADAKSAAATLQHTELTRAECRRRIYTVADETAQINLAAAAAAGTLDETQMGVYRNGLDWVAQMRATCRVLADDPQRSATDDAEWPPLPDGLAELADLF